MENILRATFELMSDQPLFYVREALIILGTPNTRDAYNIQDSVAKINQGYIIINMLSLNGLTYMFQQICQKTRGKYEVAMNEHDFKQKLMVDSPHQAYTSPIERVPEKVMNTQFIVSFPQLIFREGPVLCSNTGQMM